MVKTAEPGICLNAPSGITRGCGVALVWRRRPVRRSRLPNQAPFVFEAQTRITVV
jgi:hypothetical protein